MSLTSDTEPGATTVISHRVKPNCRAAYEAWLQKIIPVSKSCPGHRGVQVIRPIEGVNTVYTILLRFASEPQALAWMHSADRARLIAETSELLEAADGFTVQSGLDFWFTPEEVRAKVPTRWKQFLLTWSAIYPLVSLLPLGLTPLLDALAMPENRYLRALPLTGAVVWLMVYVIMPRYTKLVHRWLFR